MGKSKLARLIDSIEATAFVAPTKIMPLAINEPTKRQYISLQDAYSILNRKCFGDTLPPVLVTFQRHKKALGYYSNDRLESRHDGSKISEIALNIASFSIREDRQIFSTLLHEMVHHWQYVYGKPSRNGYHNQEWAEKMKSVGLYPSDTGLPNGKETGQQMTHYIITGSIFDTVFNDLQKAGITIDYNSLEPSKEAKKASNKIKYTCPLCEANAWGKPELNIVCGDCDSEMLTGE